MLGLSRVESRFDAQHLSGAAPLLGRDEELAILVRRWEQAKCGEGRVVLLTGEPGIGKSRLVRAVRDQLAIEALKPLSYFCAPTFQDSTLYPFVRQITGAAAIERTDSDDRKLDKLEALLAARGDIESDTPLLAALLSIPGGNRHPLPNISSQHRKERTLAILLDLMKQFAAQQPVLMVFEDLHWIDPTSLEALSLAIDQIEGQRILLIATARSGFSPPWSNQSYIATVHLGRLDRAAVLALVEDVAQGKSLPAEVLEQILTRTDGVPLFVEQLTKTIIESGLLRKTGEQYELTGRLPELERFRRRSTHRSLRGSTG